MWTTCEWKSRDVSQVFLSNINSAFDIVVYAKMSFEKIFEFTVAGEDVWVSKSFQQLWRFFAW